MWFSRSIVPHTASRPGTGKVVAVGQNPHNSFDSQNLSGRNGKWYRRLVIAIVILRVTWALVTPIKNVVIIKYPNLRTDELSTTSTSYNGYNASAKLTYSGKEILSIIQKVLAISLDNSQVRAIFEEVQDFAIDQLGHILSPEEHKAFTDYYTLVFQSSEFPGGVFTVTQHTLQHTQPDGSKYTYKLGCRADQTLLSGKACEDPQGKPCDDSVWFQSPPAVTLKDVDFAPFLNDTGWQNNIGLLGVIDYFHYYMRLLFTKKKWADVVVTTINTGFGQVSWNDEGQPFIDFLPQASEYNFYITKNIPNITTNSTMIWNCFASEIILSETYIANYTLGYIQDALIQRGLYNATAIIVNHPIIAERALVVLDGDIHITSGAGFGGYRNTVRSLWGGVMTETTISSNIIKGDRPMSGVQLMGSSIRNILYMGFYTNNYYGVLTTYPNGSEFNMVLSALGGMFAGYNGFKFDFVHNTMTNFKLAERPSSAGTGYATNWFDQEAAIAKWYAKYQSQRGTNNLIDKAALRLGPIPDIETSCYQALHKTLAQIAWIVMLQMHPVTEHLAFQSVDASSTPDAWFLNQMLVNELVVENPYGYRIHLQYNPTNTSTKFGTGWPLVPLIAALQRRHGTTTAVVQLQTAFNSTFPTLAGFKNGGFQFSDVDSCSFGGVTATDSPTSAYNKIYTPISLHIGDILASVDGLLTQIESELGVSIQIRSEYLNDTRQNSIFKYEGPPIYWYHTPLSVGLLKLSSKSSPDIATAQMLQTSLVCYDVFETRYLNRSTRCYAETRTTNETRAQYNSEGLRTLLLSFWSMGVVLNLFSGVVALRFALRIIKVARITHLQDHASVLFNIDIGLTSMPEAAIMACGTAPFMFSYQLPADSEYIADSGASQLGSIYLVEVFITMGLTWLIRIGMDCGSTFMKVAYQSLWFRNLDAITRHIIIAIIFIVRVSTISSTRDYNTAINDFVVYCCAAWLAGFSATVFSAIMHKPASLPKDDPAFNQVDAPRNVYCIFSQHDKAWSYVGLVLDGWQCVTCDEMLIFKSKFNNLLLIVQGSRVQVQPLHPIDYKSMQQLNRVVAPSTLHSDSESTTLSSSLLWRVLIVHCIWALQAAWSLSVPIRNVLLFPYPSFNYDNSTTFSSPYTGFEPSNNVSFTGSQVLSILKTALDISLHNTAVRQHFELSGKYDIDQLSQLLTPQEHNTMASLYALIHQASEFPGGVLIARHEKVVQLFSNGSKHIYTVGCDKGHTVLGGTTCIDSQGQPCVSGVTTPSFLVDVDFSPLLNRTGWQNNVALLSAVEYFQLIMTRLFATKNWATVVSMGNHGLGAVQLSNDGYLIETPQLLALVANNNSDITYNSTIIWNCVAVEILLAEVYIYNFTLRLIQDALAESNLYMVQQIVPLNSHIQTQSLAVFSDSNSLHMTSAAGFYNYIDNNESIFGVSMTQSSVSTTIFKRDIDLTNVKTMGSSVRQLLVLASDTARQFSVVRANPSVNEYIIDTRLLGAISAGYQGFKMDLIHNTMGVYKLSELSSEHPDGPLLQYFNQENEIASWYASYENQAGTNNFIDQAAMLLGPITSEAHIYANKYQTRCYQGLMKRISQIVWLAALRLHPELQYLAYMSAQNEESDHDWFLRQMMMDEMMGETPTGDRTSFPFSIQTVSPNNGCGWPIVPLLHGLNQVYNASYLHNIIMAEMNTTFTSLVELEFGDISFRDITHCPIGKVLHGVRNDDTLATAYAKIEPALDRLIVNMIAGIGDVHAQMESTLKFQIRVPLSYFQNKTALNTYSFKMLPPTLWTHTPLGVGLVRLSTKESPFPLHVLAWKSSITCYEILETRTLTRSTRCWSEPLSITESRSAYTSRALRICIFSAWSIGVTLNVIGGFITIGYVRRLYQLAHCVGYDIASIDWKLLLSTRQQCPGGITSVAASALLASTSLPLLFAYRLPQAKGFASSARSVRLPYFDELVMTLGLTWTIHLGMELGKRYTFVHTQNQNHCLPVLNLIAKVLVMVIIYGLLLITQNNPATLIFVWIGCFLLGICSIVISRIFYRVKGLSRIEAATKFINPTNSNANFNAFQLPRSEFGYLTALVSSCSSQVEMFIDGWRGVTRGSNMPYFLACGRMLWHVDGKCAKAMPCHYIRREDFDRLVNATELMIKCQQVYPKVNSSDRGEQ